MGTADRGGRCWRHFWRNRFHLDFLFRDVSVRKEGRKSVSVFNHVGGYVWEQRKTDFKGYRSKTSVSYLPKLICIYYEVKTCRRYPGKLLVITHNVVTKFFFKNLKL